MDTLLLSWHGGEHEFALPLGQLRALQDSCDAGPEQIFNRMRMGEWRIDDILETLRLGLIGGGLDKKEAGSLVLRICDQGDLANLKLTALQVLQHALFAPADDPLGEEKGVDAAAPENGVLHKSTGTVG